MRLLVGAALLITAGCGSSEELALLRSSLDGDREKIAKLEQSVAALKSELAESKKSAEASAMVLAKLAGQLKNPAEFDHIAVRKITFMDGSGSAYATILNREDGPSFFMQTPDGKSTAMIMCSSDRASITTQRNGRRSMITARQNGFTAMLAEEGDDQKFFSGLTADNRAAIGMKNNGAVTMIPAD